MPDLYPNHIYFHLVLGCSAGVQLVNSEGFVSDYCRYCGCKAERDTEITADLREEGNTGSAWWAKILQQTQVDSKLNQTLNLSVAN